MPTHKRRICFVIHRYDRSVTSGAELECYLYAQHLKKFYDIDIITTCSLNDDTWGNVLDAGISFEDGVRILRFRTDSKRHFSDIRPILRSNHNYEDEIGYLQKTGPFSKSLLSYVVLHQNNYATLLFFTYYYYQSSICMLGVRNAIFIPTAHEEEHIHIPHYKRVFKHPKGYIFQSSEEKKLVEKLFGIITVKNEICGCGIDHIATLTEKEFKSRFNINYPYFIFCGRICESKIGHLIEWFLKLKRVHAEIKEKLVLTGSLGITLPRSEDIVYLGFLPDIEKNALIQHARASILLSKYESLSIFLLESMHFGVPVLVNSECSVCKEHVIQSKAGRYVSNFEEFSTSILEMQNQLEYETLCKNAKKYVLDEYTWDKVTLKLRKVIDSVGISSIHPPSRDSLENTSHLIASRIVRKYDDEKSALVYACDNNYFYLLDCSLTSVFDHRDIHHKYDIVILSDGISPQNIHYIERKYSCTNFSVRCIEVSNRLEGHVFQFSNKKLTRVAFIRLLIPELFREYSKALYLDCDTIVLSDVHKLMSTDISNQLFAAIEDPHISVVKLYRESVKQHFLSNLHFNISDKYFNSGVLLFNIKNIADLYSSCELFKIAESRQWLWEDQDVLNLIARNRVRWLDFSWNVIWVGDERIQNLMDLNYEYFVARTNPKILHYAGGKIPLNGRNDLYSASFWNYAKQSVFYHFLIAAYLQNGTPVTSNPPHNHKLNFIKLRYWIMSKIHPSKRHRSNYLYKLKLYR